MLRVAPFMIVLAVHNLTLCLWLLKCSNGTLQLNQPNLRVAETPDDLNYSLRFLLDASLIPLIEDLFKELAMIEACNKVRKNSAGNVTVFSFPKQSTRLARAQSYHASIILVDDA